MYVHCVAHAYTAFMLALHYAYTFDVYGNTYVTCRQPTRKRTVHYNFLLFFEKLFFMLVLYLSFLCKKILTLIA